MLNLLRFVLRTQVLRSAVPHAATVAFAAALGLAALPASVRAESPDSVPGSLEMDPEALAIEELSGELEYNPPGPPGPGMEFPPVFDSFSWIRIGDTIYVTGQVTSLTGGDTVEFGGVTSGSVTVDAQGFFNFSFSYGGLTGYFIAIATDLNGVESEMIIEAI